MSLVLKVKTEWSSYTLDLREGQSVVLGRSPEATIQIPRPSVSQQHLRITWDGTELVFKDLNSSNGTYRMPQDSPFVEARFPSRSSQILLLKISKSIIEFSWELHDATSTMALDRTRTEVASGGHSPSANKPVVEINSSQASQKLSTLDLETRAGASIVKQPIAKQPSSTAKKKTSHTQEQFVEEVQDNGPGIETKLHQVLNQHPDISPATATESSAWLIATLLTGLAFLVSFVGGRLVLQGVTSAKGMQLRNGGMLDVLILWGGFIVNRPLWVALVVLVSSVVFYLVVKRMRSGHSAVAGRFAEKLQHSGWAPVWPARFSAVAFFALFFLWPLVWAAIYQTPPSKVFDAIHFWRVLNKPASTPNERVVQLRGLLPKLQGSSLLYKEIFLIQRQRILSECKGVGAEAPWTDKKVCLVLLTAVAIESLEEVQPGLLGDVAARAAILLSLDGISRVVAVEGLEAPTIPFFLNSLDAVGLGSEREDIEKLIYHSGTDQNTVLNSLLDLRKRIELRLEARQLEMKLPRIFSMQFPSPIEVGI